MSSMNIGNFGLGKQGSSKNNLLSKSSSPSKSKSPTKEKTSLSKIDVIEEVRESRDGHLTSTTENPTGTTPGRERAGSIRGGTPFRLRP